jgi:hypothetical protein
LAFLHFCGFAQRSQIRARRIVLVLISNSVHYRAVSHWHGSLTGRAALTIRGFRYTFSDAGAIQEVVSTGLGVVRKDIIACTAAYDRGNTRSGNPTRQLAHVAERHRRAGRLLRFLRYAYRYSSYERTRGLPTISRCPPARCRSSKQVLGVGSLG